MLLSVRRSLIAAAAIAAIATIPAQAQFNSNSGTKGFAITAEAGGYFASQLYNVQGANLHFGDAFTYGGRLLYTPAPHFGVEVGYMYASSDVTSDVPLNNAPSTNLGSLGLNEIDLNGLFGGGNGGQCGQAAGQQQAAANCLDERQHMSLLKDEFVWHATSDRCPRRCAAGRKSRTGP